MVRIINNTASTRILCYGEGGKNQLTIKRYHATSPLSDSHPVFNEAAIQHAISSKQLLVVKDEEYKKSYNKIKGEVVKTAVETKKTIEQKIVANEQEIRKAEEHNKYVDMVNEANKVIGKVTSSRDISTESLVEDEKATKVSVPERIKLEKDNKVDYSKLTSANASDISDPESVTAFSSKKNKKNKNKNKDEAKSTEADSDEPVVDSTDNADGESNS